MPILYTVIPKSTPYSSVIPKSNLLVRIQTILKRTTCETRLHNKLSGSATAKTNRTSKVQKIQLRKIREQAM